jgi:DNA-binding transcriptional LysR family regulator
MARRGAWKTFVGVDSWAFGEQGDVVVPIRGPMRASNGDALLAAAIAGLGLTCQPTFMLAEAVRSGLLTPIQLDHPPPSMGGIYAIYAPGARLPTKARVFIDYLAAAFKGVPPWDRSLDKIP